MSGRRPDPPSSRPRALLIVPEVYREPVTVPDYRGCYWITVLFSGQVAGVPGRPRHFLLTPTTPSPLSLRVDVPVAVEEGRYLGTLVHPGFDSSEVLGLLSHLKELQICNRVL